MKNIILAVSILAAPISSLAGITDDYSKFIGSLAYCLNVQTVMFGATMMSLNDVEKGSDKYRTLKNVMDASNPEALSNLFNMAVPKERERDRLYRAYTDEISHYSLQELITKSKECSVMSEMLKQ